jgi:hypothetical protein
MLSEGDAMTVECPTVPPIPGYPARHTVAPARCVTRMQPCGRFEPTQLLLCDTPSLFGRKRARSVFRPEQMIVLRSPNPHCKAAFEVDPQKPDGCAAISQ